MDGLNDSSHISHISKGQDDIDSYTVVSEKLESLKPGLQFKIRTGDHNANKFSQKKMIRHIIHNFPAILRGQESSSRPELYEVRIGGSDKFGNIYAVLNRGSIPENLCTKYNIEFDRKSSSIKGARYLILDLISKALGQMSRENYTYVTSKSCTNINGQQDIHIPVGDWKELCSTFDYICNLNNIKICFFYKLCHGMKMPVVEGSLEQLKLLMHNEMGKCLFYQLHVSFTLRGEESNGIFVDLNKLGRSLLTRPAVCGRVRKFKIIDGNIGTFSGVTSMHGCPPYVTNINAYTPNYHQLQGFLNPYAIVTSDFLNSNIFNKIREFYLENFKSIVMEYCNSIEEGMPLRIEFVISLDDIDKLLDENFISDSCAGLLHLFLKSELLIKVDNVKSHVEEIKKAFQNLIVYLDNDDSFLTRAKLTEIYERENKFWLLLQSSSFGLIKYTNDQFQILEDDGEHVTVANRWNNQFIVSEFLPPQPEKWDTYKLLMTTMYKSFLCDKNWDTDFFADSALPNFSEIKKKIYLLFKMYLHYAKFIKILPTEKLTGVDLHILCPLHHMQSLFIDDASNNERKKWHSVLESPHTVARAICEPRTFEGHLLSGVVTEIEKNDKIFQKAIVEFMKEYCIDAFPTYFLNGCEHLHDTWSAVHIMSRREIPESVELSGDLRKMKNLI